MSQQLRTQCLPEALIYEINAFKPITDASASNKTVKTVSATRSVEAFVLGIHPTTTTAEFTDLILLKMTFRLTDRDKLAIKYEHFYLLFDVEL
jgi:hypothetical protein